MMRGVYGASGFGREVMPLVRQQYKSEETSFVFIDDGITAKSVNGHDVLSYEDFLSHNDDDKSVVVAIADSQIRERIEQKCLNDGIQISFLQSETVLIGDECEIGAGFILCGFVQLTSNLVIGKSFHANIYSYVAHDCLIGDYVTFAPGVKCNGNVHIGDHAYIGTGAILKQGTPDKPLIIGPRAIVGMGAVVTKDVAADTVVVGNPARMLQAN